jgi:hypothetical protein
MRILLVATAIAGCAQVDDRPADWGYVHTAIIAPACATVGCHSTAAATAGIDLSTPTTAYTFLTGRICGQPIGPGNYVVPGSPTFSTLVYQLRGTARTRMPPDNPLPEVEIQLIEQWIAEGALCE